MVNRIKVGIIGASTKQGSLSQLMCASMLPAYKPSELEDIVTGTPTIQKITQEAKRQGMITLRQDGVLKALDGLVSLEEILRETEE